jgi:hypothetical protein
LTAYFQIIQDVLGKDISLAAWDEEQRKAFPPIKSYKKLPQSRESLGIYLGPYVNPKTEGSKVYLNLRLVTTKAHQVPLAKLAWNQPTNLQAPSTACPSTDNPEHAKPPNPSAYAGCFTLAGV